MKTIRLNNGLEVPAVGCGTNSFAKTNGFYDGHTDEVVSALKAGYRFFDTAESYGNEEAVGKGIRESGVGRENVLISTKMRTKFPGQEGEISHSPRDAEDAIERSLAKLQTDYIDIYLIHMPWGNPAEASEVWKVLEDYYDRGVLRAIGVSNFTEEDLIPLLEHCRIRPMIDQIRISPTAPNSRLADFCLEKGIVPMAWGPLRGIEDKSALIKTGEKYRKSWAQVILRRNYQKGIISIPKSHSFTHQRENLDIFDFELTENELF